MQTDPNWANFLYDPSNDKITLIDFGASREYTKDFMDGWYRLLTAGLRGDRVAMKVESESLGYLTGEENDVSGWSSHPHRSQLNPVNMVARGEIILTPYRTCSRPTSTRWP